MLEKILKSFRGIFLKNWKMLRSSYIKKLEDAQQSFSEKLEDAQHAISEKLSGVVEKASSFQKNVENDLEKVNIFLQDKSFL